MSSAFQGSEFQSIEEKVEESPKEVPKEPEPMEDPRLAVIKPLLSQLEQWTQGEQDVNKIWKFVSAYITLLERHPKVMTFIQKHYGQEVGTSLIQALKNISGDDLSLVQMLHTVLSLNDHQLSQEEKEEFNILKLNLPQGQILPMVMSAITSLPPNAHNELVSLYTNEMNKYSSGGSSSMLNTQYKIPGTSVKMDCKYIILIVVVLLILLGSGVWYYFKGSSSVMSAVKSMGNTVSDDSDVGSIMSE